jgi:hypothetical protein
VFYYVFTVSGLWTEEDIRIIESRSEAPMYMSVLGLRPRVLCNLPASPLMFQNCGQDSELEPDE